MEIKPTIDISDISDAKKYFIEIERIAKEKGGICLSKKYINSQTKLKFR